jgi:hypothetical protein
MLQPGGPVMFVFDVADTEATLDAPPLPPEVEQPFEVRKGRVGNQFELTIDNAKRDGVVVARRGQGSQSAGSIQLAAPGRYVDVPVKFKPERTCIEVPVRYDLLLNVNYSAESQYVTLVHELAHLYCGHLGTANEEW